MWYNGIGDGMYKYNDDTLIHSVGNDFSAINSIMDNGIVSEKYGKEHGISINRNYYGSNLDDTISCIRYLYVNETIEDSAYNRYVPNGISFIIEDTPFIHDKDARFIHRSDEVLVKDFIPKENIKGILVPENLINTDLEDLSYIRGDSTSYILIKHRLDNVVNYIASISDIKCDYEDYLRELYYLSEEAKNVSEAEQIDIYEEFKDIIKDLNYEIGLDYKKCFSKILNKDNINILDIINYINNNSLQLPIYVVEDKKVNKNRHS